MNKIKKILLLPILGISLYSFASSNIDSTSVKIVNLTDNVMITDYAKEFIDINQIPYIEISDLYNKIITNSDSDLLFFKKSEKITVGYKKYKNMELSMTVENKRKIIKSVSIDYE